MTEQELIRAYQAECWLHYSEIYQKLAEVTGTIGLGFIPILLFIAASAFLDGDNVPGVFLWFGISDIISWTLFGMCTLLRNHYKKKLLELTQEA